MFIHRLGRGIVFSSGAVLLSALPAFAASPSLALSRTKVRAGFGVTVRGHHFRPSSYVAIMFAYPKLGKHSFERFVGKARTNASGSFTQQVQIPRIAQCGTASIYGQEVGTSSFIGKKITLTGCKGGKLPSKP